MATFTGTAGADSFIGGTGDDLFRFTPATLQAGDTVDGGGGAGIDTLQFTAAGAFPATVQAGISGIDRVLFSALGNALTLAASLVASAGGLLEVRGAAGDDLLDASTLFDPGLRVNFLTGLGGADTLIGGTGNDSATIQAAGTRLFQLGGGNDSIAAAHDVVTATDALLGGAGIDRLTFTTAGNVAGAALMGLSSIEEIALPNLPGMTLTFGDALVSQAGGVLKVIGNNARQEVYAAGVSTGAVFFSAAGGNDYFEGGDGADTVESSDALHGFLGAGNDVARLTSTLAGASSLFGEDGHDQIVLTRGGDWILGPFVDGFEEVEITANGTRLTLNATQGLDVTGSAFSDRVTLGAARQAFFGFEGNDTVLLTAARMTGVALHGGAQTTRDTLVMQGTGSFDFRRAFVTGFERFEAEAAATAFLPAQAIDVVARAGGSFTLGAHAQQAFFGSAAAETVTLGIAGQAVATRGGADTIIGSAATLALGTMIDGGGGIDTLRIQGGPVNLATGALVQNVEVVELATALQLTLDATPGLAVIGSTGADTLRAGAGDLTGTLGNQDDLLEILSTDLAVAAGSFSLGAGNDTLRVLQGSFQGSFTVPARFTDAEVLDLQPIIFSSLITLAGSLNRTVLMPATANALVVGGGGNEVFQFGPTAGSADGGAGADTLNGGTGDDAMLGSAGGDSLVGAGGRDSLGGGTGADTMIGGAGEDMFFIDGNAALTDWAGPVRTVVGHLPATNSFDTDALVVTNASGSQTLDLTRHIIESIDGILVGPGVNLTLVIGNAVAATAQAMGQLGFFAVSHFLSPASALVVNASALTAGRHLWASGSLDGADSILGGADADLVESAGGNDTVKGGDGTDSLVGGSGNDELRGENGPDTIIGGAGADSVWGDAGDDVLDGGAADGAADRFAYNANTNGSPDINSNGGPLFGADRILNFVPRTGPADATGDWIALSVAGLGLNGGATVKKLAENETWNSTTASIFIVHQNDFLVGANMASLADIAAAVNTAAGAKTGWAVNRTVVFALGNNLAGVDARTGLYWWKDVNGDGFLSDANDDVRLLASIAGVTTASFAADALVLA